MATCSGRAVFGSSPRPWGTRSRRRCTGRSYRFIPTPVGNAFPTPTAVFSRPVHPHARGERVAAALAALALAGSSPRPWGTPLHAGRRWRNLRFIPTPVGNAYRQRIQGSWRTVHPHARGERARNSVAELHMVGSSPRPWGTRNGRPCQPAGGRFIPTPVGNAALIEHGAPDHAVHPHARGERAKFFSSGAQFDGSSPRPWGTRSECQEHPVRRRFIPTPVGNAAAPGRACRAEPVHPHARGERASRAPGMSLPAGSSPRPWGTL